MFIGHYAPAAALKPLTAKVPLWHYFVAVQFLDFLWAIFILAGIEKARIVPGFLAASDVDLYYMPYTHSLAAAALWSAAAVIVYRFVLNARAGAAGALLIGAAVMSHWPADLIVHAKDLALYPGSPVRLGWSLWSSVVLSQGLEFSLIAVGLVIYLAATRAKGAAGWIAPFIVAATMAAVQAYSLAGEPPADIRMFAVLALVSYTLFAALAAWLDATRVPRQR